MIRRDERERARRYKYTTTRWSSLSSVIREAVRGERERERETTAKICIAKCALVSHSRIRGRVGKIRRRRSASEYSASLSSSLPGGASDLRNKPTANLRPFLFSLFYFLPSQNRGRPAALTMCQQNRRRADKEAPRSLSLSISAEANVYRRARKQIASVYIYTKQGEKKAQRQSETQGERDARLEKRARLSSASI